MSVTLYSWAHMGVEYPQRWKLSPSNLFQCLICYFFLLFYCSYLYCTLFPGTTGKNFDLSSSFLLLQVFIHINSPPNLPFSKTNSLRLSWCVICSSCTVFEAFVGLSLTYPCPSCTEEPRNEYQLCIPVLGRRQALPCSP